MVKVFYLLVGPIVFLSDGKVFQGIKCLSPYKMHACKFGRVLGLGAYGLQKMFQFILTIEGSGGQGINVKN